MLRSSPGCLLKSLGGEMQHLIPLNCNRKFAKNYLVQSCTGKLNGVSSDYIIDIRKYGGKREKRI